MKFIMTVWSKMSKLLINATLSYCSYALVTFLYQYFYHERNEVILFYGLQKPCSYHRGSAYSLDEFKNRDCSKCKVNKILEWLNEAEKSLDVCIYMINCNIFTNALIDAHERGVIVRIIVNEENNNATWKLGIHGIAKRAKRPAILDNLMHHKFIIIDNKKIILGSLNWTKSGIRYNWENVFLTNRQEFIKPFRQEFQRLWTKFS